PQGCGQAHLPVDGHYPFRHAQGGAANAARSAEKNVHPAAHLESHGHDGCYRFSTGQAAQHEEQRRLLRVDERVTNALEKGAQRGITSSAAASACGLITGNEQVSPTQTKAALSADALIFSFAGCAFGSA